MFTLISDNEFHMLARRAGISAITFTLQTLCSQGRGAATNSVPWASDCTKSAGSPCQMNPRPFLGITRA